MPQIIGSLERDYEFDFVQMMEAVKIEYAFTGSRFTVQGYFCLQAVKNLAAQFFVTRSQKNLTGSDFIEFASGLVNQWFRSDLNPNL